MTQTFVTLGVFLSTFILMLSRPFHLSEGWIGTIGATLMLILGSVSWLDVLEVVQETGNTLFMLLAMMITSLVVERAGFFDWMAAHSAKRARGSGVRLFRNTFIMGTLVTTVISNDATALIITPIVYSFVLALGLNPLPFLLICTFIADTASLSLPVSNLTNLLVYDQLKMEFIPYVLAMFLPTVVAVLVNYGVFRLVFRKLIPQTIAEEHLPNPNDHVKHPRFFKFSSIGLVVLVFAYVLGSWVGIPLVAIAVLGAMVLVLGGLYYRQIKLKQVLGQISWSIIVFVLGMFIVVRGIQNTGLPFLAGEWLLNNASGNLLKGILYTSLGTALGSNVINNVPMDMLMISVVKGMAPMWHDPLGYAIILGAGLGPNLTVIGSLATMLWLGTIRRKGVDITAWQYIKIGILTTPLMVILSSVALWFSLVLMGIS